jgi:hypothetical protein
MWQFGLFRNSAELAEGMYTMRVGEALDIRCNIGLITVYLDGSVGFIRLNTSGAKVP